MRKMLIGAVIGVLALSACAGANSADDPSAAPQSALDPCGDTLQEITQAAQAEGAPTLIATPDDWANYRTIIDEEYRRTEESGYASLERMYGYKPDQFKKNIHWENTPYNTVPRRIFEDRTPMTRDEFEGATGTIKHSKP